jgi:hypothetical protein
MPGSIFRLTHTITYLGNDGLAALRFLHNNQKLNIN